jgi:hypothetical protein
MNKRRGRNRPAPDPLRSTMTQKEVIANGSKTSELKNLSEGGSVK